jgi:hypothetical protein
VLRGSDAWDRQIRERIGSLWSNQTSMPAALKESQIFWAACASCEA